MPLVLLIEQAFTRLELLLLVVVVVDEVFDEVGEFEEALSPDDEEFAKSPLLLDVFRLG